MRTGLGEERFGDGASVDRRDAPFQNVVVYVDCGYSRHCGGEGDVAFGVADGDAVGEGDVERGKVAQHGEKVFSHGAQRHVGDDGGDGEACLDGHVAVGHITNGVVCHAVSIPLALRNVNPIRKVVTQVDGVVGRGGGVVVEFDVGDADGVAFEFEVGAEFDAGDDGVGVA